MNEINLLKNLVSIPSVSTKEKKVSVFLTQKMKGLGFEKSFIDKTGNAVGIKGSGKKQIVLLGHIDTVAGNIKVRIKNNKLYGRGAVDAKGSLAAFTIAVSKLTKKDLSKKQVVVIGAVEEEITTSRGARFVLNKYNPKFCIIGEPSGWNKITLGYKGILNLDYEIKTENKHHTLAEKTPSKIGLKFIQKLEKFLKSFQKEKIYDSPVLEIRSINTSNNGLKQSLFMSLALRLPPNFDVKSLKNFIKSIQKPAKITYTQELPGILSDKQNDLVAVFNEAIRSQGGTPKFLKKTGSSDMCIAGPYWKCPILAYGPGDSALDHAPNEHLDLAEYSKSILVLQNVLKNL